MTTDPRRRSRRRRSGGAAHKPQSQSQSQPQPQSPAATPKPREVSQERAEELARTPFVAVTVKTTGIHPSTAQLVVIDAVVLTASGEPDSDFHAVLSVPDDPGPKHMHGLSREEIADGKSFSSVLKALGKTIDGRTMITHNVPLVWGFIHKEARRAMTAAARANRRRGSRGKPRRRQRVGHVPRPVGIVDMLATARRRGVDLPDTRIRTVARMLGVECEPATATVERARQPEFDVTRAETLLVADMFFRDPDHVVVVKPDELQPDRFGLQRSSIRVAAANATPKFHNPGVFAGTLVQGMQIVVAPEITADPDDIIRAITTHDLSYSEKVTRQTSLVVCNKQNNLSGKAMHAARKGVPLMADDEFLTLVSTTQITPGEPTPPPETSPVLRSITGRSTRQPRKKGSRRVSRR